LLQDLDQETLKKSFSKLFPSLSGDELDGAHDRFQQYVALVWEVVEDHFDRQTETAYAEDTKVDS
jgi:hypothetical protein